jgi:hypothetical protein
MKFALALISLIAVAQVRSHPVPKGTEITLGTFTLTPVPFSPPSLTIVVHFTHFSIHLPPLSRPRPCGTNSMHTHSICTRPNTIRCTVLKNGWCVPPSSKNVREPFAIKGSCASRVIYAKVSAHGDGCVSAHTADTPGVRSHQLL